MPINTPIAVGISIIKSRLLIAPITVVYIPSSTITNEPLTPGIIIAIAATVTPSRSVINSTGFIL